MNRVIWRDFLLVMVKETQLNLEQISVSPLLLFFAFEKLIHRIKPRYLLRSDSEGIQTLPGTEGRRVGSVSGR